MKQMLAKVLVLALCLGLLPSMALPVAADDPAETGVYTISLSADTNAISGTYDVTVDTKLPGSPYTVKTDTEGFEAVKVGSFDKAPKVDFSFTLDSKYELGLVAVAGTALETTPTVDANKFAVTVEASKFGNGTNGAYNVAVDVVTLEKPSFKTNLEATQTVGADNTLTLTVEANELTAKGGTLAYQWYKQVGEKQAEKIQGANESSYTTDKLAKSDDGTKFYVEVTSTATKYDKTVSSTAVKSNVTAVTVNEQQVEYTLAVTLGAGLENLAYTVGADANPVTGTTTLKAGATTTIGAMGKKDTYPTFNISYTVNDDVTVTDVSVAGANVNVSENKVVVTLTAETGTVEIKTKEKAQVAAPTFSPVAGEVAANTEVTISTTTEGATIYYTTDGSTPTSASSVYAQPITIDAAMTINAIAVKDGMKDSEVATAEYTLKQEQSKQYTISVSVAEMDDFSDIVNVTYRIGNDVDQTYVALPDTNVIGVTTTAESETVYVKVAVIDGYVLTGLTVGADGKYTYNTEEGENETIYTFEVQVGSSEDPVAVVLTVEKDAIELDLTIIDDALSEEGMVEDLGDGTIQVNSNFPAAVAVIVEGEYKLVNSKVDGGKRIFDINPYGVENEVYVFRKGDVVADGTINALDYGRVISIALKEAENVSNEETFVADVIVDNKIDAMDYGNLISIALKERDIQWDEAALPADE